MPRPNLPFNGLHLRNPCKLHGSLLIFQTQRDGRLSWPSWLTHSGRLTHEAVTRQPWIRRSTPSSVRKNQRGFWGFLYRCLHCCSILPLSPTCNHLSSHSSAIFHLCIMAPRVFLSCLYYFQDLVLRFLQRAASNLQQEFKVVVPSSRLPVNSRRTILAAQLRDFVHIYNSVLYHTVSYSLSPRRKKRPLIVSGINRSQIFHGYCQLNHV